MYHRVNDAMSLSDLIISKKRFKEQMKYLKSFCNVISLLDVYDMYFKQGKIEYKRRPQVIITLDDGYYDSYRNAYPILKEFGLNATIFLTTGFINTDKKMLRYENMPAPDMLTWEEVRTMKKGGITFCPHTETHPHLAELRRLEQKAEIQNSINALVKNVSAEEETKIFSYTYGEYNKVTLDVLKELDIKIAVTVKPGINTLNDNPLELRRITVDGRDDLVDFMKKISPFERFKLTKTGRMLSFVKKILRKVI